MQKILFLDLDGTIRKPASGNKFISDPKDQEPIKGTQEFVKRASKNYSLVGITNQGGVAAGHKSMEGCIKEQEYTLKLFPEIDQILFSPDYSGQSVGVVSQNKGKVYPKELFEKIYTQTFSSFRKPGAGMLQLTIRQFNTRWIQDCWMIGDRPEDEKAANSAGVNFLSSEKLNLFLSHINDSAGKCHWDNPYLFSGKEADFFRDIFGPPYINDIFFREDLMFGK